MYFRSAMFNIINVGVPYCAFYKRKLLPGWETKHNRTGLQNIVYNNNHHSSFKLYFICVDGAESVNGSYFMYNVSVFIQLHT